MTGQTTYDVMRHFADSWGLVIMVGVFLTLILWPFRPGNPGHHRDAARMIFDKDEQADSQKDVSHGA